MRPKWMLFFAIGSLALWITMFIVLTTFAYRTSAYPHTDLNYVMIGHVDHNSAVILVRNTELPLGVSLLLIILRNNFWTGFAVGTVQAWRWKVLVGCDSSGKENIITPFLININDLLGNSWTLSNPQISSQNSVCRDWPPIPNTYFSLSSMDSLNLSCRSVRHRYPELHLISLLRSDLAFSQKLLWN